MRARSVCGSVLLISSLFLSGCTFGPEETDPDTSASDPVLHTSPDDLGNATDSGRSHIHDYWNGLDRFYVFDETFDLPGCSACGRGAPFFRFEPPAQAFFPQGTRWVNLTVEWSTSDTSYFGDTTLWVETAADLEPQKIGPMASGDTVTIEITNNTQNDLPHEILSNWAFEVRVGEGVPLLNVWRASGTGRVAAEVARGLPLPVFPPHPDRWNGTNEIELFDQTDAAEPYYYGNPVNGQSGINWLGPHKPDNGTVVPHDMDHVEVVVTYEDDALIPFTLAFHGGESRDWTLIEPGDTDGQMARYVITPHQGRPDGPYLQQSNWVFEIFTDEDRPLFVGGYRIKATAHKDAL